MSERFYDILVKKFDRSGHGVVNFDDFIQCCVVIQVGFPLFFRYDESDKIKSSTDKPFLLPHSRRIILRFRKKNVISHAPFFNLCAIIYRYFKIHHTV